MYGYPEQFIPPEEYPAGATTGAPVPAPSTATPATVSAMSAEPRPAEKPQL